MSIEMFDHFSTTDLLFTQKYMTLFFTLPDSVSRKVCNVSLLFLPLPQWVHPDFVLRFLKKGEALMCLSPELMAGAARGSSNVFTQSLLRHSKELCFSLMTSRLDIILSGGLRRWGGRGKLYSRLCREGSSFSRSRKRASEGSCCQSALSSCYDTGPNSNHVSSHPVSCFCPPLALAVWTDPFHCPSPVLRSHSPSPK